MYQIALIGGGNIGLSLAKGLVEKGYCQAAQITLTRRQSTFPASVHEMGFATAHHNTAAIQHAQIVILAVLPHQLPALLQDIGQSLRSDQLLISLISGITCADLSAQLPVQVSVIRAMPNTAIAIGQSMTCIATENASPDQLKIASSLFHTVGMVMEIDEALMPAATALCASGIAFFLRSIRAASQAGVEVGFHPHEALKMAVQTAKGASGLLKNERTHPEKEIDKVTSPKGCTIAGLNEMEFHGFSNAYIKGIKLAAARAGSLHERVSDSRK